MTNLDRINAIAWAEYEAELEREEAIEDEAYRLNELHDDDFYPLSKMRG